ncbi:mekA [Symbiodinium sp. CCMP2592]|nr:mekA [Symbiodinium sp. CCMP2592]
MEEAAAAWPEQFKLSKMWDSCEITRDQMRKQQRLLDWQSAQATGVATKATLKLNRFVVRKTMQVKEIHRLLVTSPDTVKMYVDEWGLKRLMSYTLRRYRTGALNFRDATLQPIMNLMIAKWGGGDPDGENGGDDEAGEAGDPSDGEGHHDDAPVVEAEHDEPAVEYVDPYLLPDGQVFEPYSEDEFGDPVPCPNNQEPVPTPDNQELEMPTPDNHELEMPVLGGPFPTPDNQELEMPLLGGPFPTPDNQELEMPLLGGPLPTPDNQELEIGVPSKEPAEMPVIRDHEVAYHEFSWWVFGVLVGKQKLAEKQAQRAIAARTSCDPSSLDTQPFDIFDAAAGTESIASAPEKAFTVLDFKAIFGLAVAEVSRTEQFKGKPGKRKAGGHEGATANEGEQGDESDEDDDEPVVKKRPAAKRTKTNHGGAASKATGGRGRGRGRGRGCGGKKPGSSIPPEEDAKVSGDAADEPGEDTKPSSDAADEPEEDAKASSDADDEPEDEGPASPGEAKPSKKSTAKAAAKKAPKPKAGAKKAPKPKAAAKKAPKAKGKAVAKAKGKPSDEEPPVKEKVFARRPRPNPPDQAMQWQAIRDIFDSHVKPSLRFPSKHEYAWYDMIKPLFDANSTIDDYLKIARARASDFLKSAVSK